MLTRYRLSCGLSILAAAALAVCLHAAPRKRGSGKAPSNFQDRPARFRITADVVNPGLEPFTVTAGAFGNSFLRTAGGFEPVVYRNSLDAKENSADRVICGPHLAFYDTLGQGFLDGATVRVYRIIDGKMTIVRRDSVPSGGFNVKGWHGSTKKIVPAGTTTYTWSWNDYNRPDAMYYFAVGAVDRSGNVSTVSNAVGVERPAKVGKGRPSVTVPFKAPRRPKDTEAPSAPTGLKGKLVGDGTYKLTWNPVLDEDLAGYVVFHSDYDPETHTGFYLQLAGKPANEREHIKAGDRVIVSKTFSTYSRNRMASHRVWGASQNNRVALPDFVDYYPDEDPEKTWALKKHPADTPVTDGGQTYLRMTLGPEKGTSLGSYAYAGTEQNWYNVFEARPYRVEVWLKGEGEGLKPVVFHLDGPLDKAIEPIEFQVGPEWKKHVAEFTPAAVYRGGRPGRIKLSFNGPGTFCVDNFRLYRADTEYLDLLPRDYKRLAESGVASFRTHGPIKTGTTTYDMAAFTNPGGCISGVRKGNTLPQQFKMMRKAGVHPWLQIEMHMTPAEWLGFVEYIAAPYDPAKDSPKSKPWAAKRHAQGQGKPWADEFERVYFEISNETWNWLFRPWIFESMTDGATGEKYARGVVYGKFQEHIMDVMKSSPYWKAGGLDEKVVFVLGGWSGSNYGEQAVEGSPRSDYMTIAAYNGGWDEGEGPPQTNKPSFFNVLSQVNQTAIPRARKHLAEKVQWMKTGRKHDLGTYEAGPGYALNGLNNARVTREQARQQELVMKSLTAGTATLDSFLCRCYHDFDLQNFFTFGEGTHWKSHAKWYRGGQAYPCFMVLSLFNNHATGDMLKTEVLSAPTVDTAKFRRREAVEGAPLAAVYATRKGSRVNVFVLSRKIAGYPDGADDGYTAVTLDLPFTKAKSITLHKMEGDPTANNIESKDVAFEAVDIPAGKIAGSFTIDADRGGHAEGLPPAATYLYVFEGTDIAEGTLVSPQEVLAQPVTYEAK